MHLLGAQTKIRLNEAVDSEAALVEPVHYRSRLCRLSEPIAYRLIDDLYLSQTAPLHKRRTTLLKPFWREDQPRSRDYTAKCQQTHQAEHENNQHADGANVDLRVSGASAVVRKNQKQPTDHKSQATQSTKEGLPPPLNEHLMFAFDQCYTLSGISTYWTPGSPGSSTSVGLAGSANLKLAFSPVIWPATSIRYRALKPISNGSSE